MTKKLLFGILGLLVMAAVMAPSLMAQSLTTGEVAGTITDPSHAVVANAPVTLKSVDTGATHQTTTTSTGYYRFSQLRPGNYQVTVKQPGFAEVTQPAAVALGETTTADIALSMAKGAETVEVSGEAIPVITNTPSISTSYTTQEVQSLPNAGGDITNIAQSTPGAVMNNTGGYGNFTVNGLPATSNLFTVNGENDMDPYFNINNSGATNLTLGSGEVQEATVVANPYSGEYGQLSGAQVNMITKSGTNAFHGTAQYWWNGRAMNSNNWMNTNSDPVVPRAFSNANQWLANVGGPIVKNKLFFFVDTEGLRFVLPNVIPTTVPTAAFASAVLNNVKALQPNEYPLYQQMMNLFANAPGASGAQAIPNNSQCTGLKLPGFDGTTQNCFASFNGTPTALASEWILAFKVDYNLSDKDRVSGRYKLDHGVQPTYLSSINSNFDALSNQPSWDLQLQETHVFSPNVTNDFTAAGSHYVAQFAQNEQAALSTFPMALIFGGTNPLGPPSGSVGLQYDFPQGRNITQYQFIDNLSWNKGHHSFKFGGNFRRYDVSDHNFFFNTGAAYFDLASSAGNALQMFSNGVAGQYRQSDNLASNVPVALWGLGVYAMDEWKIKSNLSLTLALRVERNSNPVCQINCFANYKTPFYSLPSVEAGGGAASGAVPYTSDIAYNLHQAYQGVDNLLWSPRFGFRWDPYKQGKTVISGGIGIFYDSPPAGLVDDLLANPPVSVAIRVRPSNGTLPFDPTTNGSIYTWQQSADAFNTGFTNNASFNQLHAQLKPLGVNFVGPAFTALTGTIHAPRWQEWNFSIQQEITPSTALIINYVGNHGIRIPYENNFYNAYDEFGLWPAGTLPAAPAVPNYGTVTQVQNGALSNYNAVTVSLRRNFSKWISAHANYTWAHNMDEVSNGGIFAYGGENYNIPLNQICPQSLRSCNYGSSDYDIRNSFNADFVFHPSFHVGNKFAAVFANGWEFTGKIFWRGGLPMSIIDGNLNGGVVNSTTTVLATPILPGNAPGQGSCGGGNASISGTAPPCLNSAAFLDTANLATTGYSTQRRNQYVGPHYFDTDMSIFKNFKLKESLNFGIGIQAFNIFNHPNFQNPDNTLGDPTFGQINAMQPLPTSPYGVFLGFDSSVRVIQLSGKITF
ncbi:MAG: carboxypeptidase regulatory-like domain-containing protein [Acidobacteriota bacterium]|nr:carboxypeptidase regulatory-like domain-containing protein [Acidobacteriota bacterium]